VMVTALTYQFQGWLASLITIHAVDAR